MSHNTSSRPASAGHRRLVLRRAARATERGRVVCAQRGFTLTEILIAIALILIVGALAVYNFENLAQVDKLSTSTALQAEIRQARFLAMQRRSSVYLTYNSETHTFDLLDAQGELLENIPDGADDDQAQITLTFTPVLPIKDITTDPNTVDEESVEYSQKTPLSVLMFDPSGVTAPVKVTLSVEGKDSVEYRLDPFSEGPPPKVPENVPPLTDDSSS